MSDNHDGDHVGRQVEWVPLWQSSSSVIPAVAGQRLCNFCNKLTSARCERCNKCLVYFRICIMINNLQFVKFFLITEILLTYNLQIAKKIITELRVNCIVYIETYFLILLYIYLSLLLSILLFLINIHFVIFFSSFLAIAVHLDTS